MMTVTNVTTRTGTDFAVYVHVPYCRVQCPYCTFFTVLRPLDAAPMRRWVQAVEKEWVARVRPLLERGERLRTLYLGGGTPSDLPGDALLGLLAQAGRDVPGGLQALDEVTIECNPESATPVLLDALRALGVGRVSLGVQSLDDDDLRTLGRGNNATDARTAIRNVAARFASWNADFILGIPRSSQARLQRGLAEVVERGAPHLSFYCLEMPREPARRLGDPQTDASEGAKADLYEWASAWIESQGFEHYEISNAARPGYRALHNSAYWTGRPYVGLGPGAHSFDGPTRRANVPDLRRYLEAVEAGADAPHTQEDLTPAMRHEERILVGLRLCDGVSIEGLGLRSRHALLERLDAAGLARLEDDRFRLTPRGWLVSDSIVLQLVAP